MTLDELRAERNREWIGQGIYSVVVEICRAVVRSYDPTVYAAAPTWADSLDDLVQEVILKRLIEERQLDYALTVSASIEDFRRLMTRQVKRTLAHRRRRSVIDNLLERVSEVLAREPFLPTEPGQSRFIVAGSVKEQRDPTDAELYEAAVAATLVPKVISHGTERAPVVYSPEALAELVRVIADALPTAVSASVIGRVLRLLLTDWLASDLVDMREAEAVPAVGSLRPDEAAQVAASVAEILRDLPDQSLPVLKYKYAGLSDQEIAGRLHVSRPTVAKRKDQALAVLREHLGGERDVMRDAIVSELGLQIARST